MSVDILLATYQGEAFLSEQIDSLLSQTYQDFRIIVRDDGSTDRSKEIIQQYATTYPEKFIVLEPAVREGDSPGHLKRIIRNFSKLMEWTNAHSSPEAIMFCDQDDIWHPDKIEKTLQLMRQLTDRRGASCPLLVTTDVNVVDGELNVTTPSLVATKSDGDPNLETFRRKLVQCSFPGCTMMMNPALCGIAAPIPEGVRLHDTWVNVLAAAIGECAHFPHATLDYRQHTNNAMGGKHNRSFAAMLGRVRFVIDEYIGQAELLHERFRQEMPRDRLKDLELFLKLSNEMPFLRGLKFMEFGFARHSLLQNAGLLGGSGNKLT